MSGLRALLCLVSGLALAVVAAAGCLRGPRPPVAATPAPEPPPEPVAAAPYVLIVPSFADLTEAAGLGGVDAHYVNWFDADGDARPDLLVNGHRLYRNVTENGSIRFEESTAAAGLQNARRGPALCLDLDNDGLTDIVSTTGQLWRNRGAGTFVESAAPAGYAPHPKALTLGAGDIDGDGFADLYIGMVEDWNDGQAVYYPHQLWRNRGGERFTEIGVAAGIARKTYGRAVLFGDVDGDGRQDIFVANYRLQPNLLWRNRGDGRFEDVAERFGVAGRKQPDKYYDPIARRSYGPAYGHSIGACWLDFDNDGRLDLFTANLAHKYVGPSGNPSMGYDVRGYICDDSAIYRRTVAGFEDWREVLGVPTLPIGGPARFKGDELWAGCVAGDVNNDGWTDVFVPQVYNLEYARSKLFLNAQGERFEDHARQAGIMRLDTYAGALADVDGDGRLDVVTAGRAAVGAPPSLRLYRNAGWPAAAAPPRHWLRVRVRPGPDRQTVLGTLVRARLGAMTLTRLVTAGTSTYGQQDDPVLHFGLGEWSRPVPLTLRWPNGTEQTVDAAADSLIEVRPGPAPAALLQRGR
jgi:hypothetical protein